MTMQTSMAAAPAIPAVQARRAMMDFGGAEPALVDVDLTLEEGEFLSIVGPSGCGKSTLLKLISGLERPSGGEILVRGNPVTETPAGIGFMFQRDALLPWATVRQNIEVGLECGGFPRQARDARVEELLEFTGLKRFGDYYPSALSGGMRQRVALCRILAYAPDIYLMDEPFGALDAQTKVLMGQELLKIWSRYRKGIIFVTHDIEEAVSLSDRVVVMTGRPGRVKSQYRIDLPRPRDARQVRREPRFHEFVEAIWNDIMGSTQND
ncbi:ABC transporter ATP-binding protein [Bordetella genomosp. 8]|uniref:ABC transporter ATP-binding protein n=1 Tax=Bordetella genomosp. 8 TaxID=1416806 RepID=A0A1W6YFF1_9BORD|nr:ABC transporter ATP-binding protein [Bordetella genomosp. 8]ARP79807.1 ABC transporter ATP-binding protein [Bordetella genomosp. 8]